MAANPLFYNEIVPLNRESHAGLNFASGPRTWEFARSSHLIPAVIDEFNAAAPHLPILFVGGTTLSPIFLVGLAPGANALVSPTDEWLGGYVPAFLRRYPFILGETDDPDRTIVCIDPHAKELTTSEGVPLFAGDGEGDELKERVRLANDYWASARRTQMLVERLRDLDLLTNISVRGRTRESETNTLHGLLAVDEQRLANLEDTAFLALRRDGLLGPIYAHLTSLAAVERLSGQEPASR